MNKNLQVFFTVYRPFNKKFTTCTLGLFKKKWSTPPRLPLCFGFSASQKLSWQFFFTPRRGVEVAQGENMIFLVKTHLFKKLLQFSKESWEVNSVTGLNDLMGVHATACKTVAPTQYWKYVVLAIKSTKTWPNGMAMAEKVWIGRDVLTPEKTHFGSLLKNP